MGLLNDLEQFFTNRQQAPKPRYVAGAAPTLHGGVGAQGEPIPQAARRSPYAVGGAVDPNAVPSTREQVPARPAQPARTGRPLAVGTAIPGGALPEIAEGLREPVYNPAPDLPEDVDRPAVQRNRPADAPPLGQKPLSRAEQKAARQKEIASISGKELKKLDVIDERLGILKEAGKKNWTADQRTEYKALKKDRKAINTMLRGLGVETKLLNAPDYDPTTRSKAVAAGETGFDKANEMVRNFRQRIVQGPAQVGLDAWADLNETIAKNKGRPGLGAGATAAARAARGPIPDMDLVAKFEDAFEKAKAGSKEHIEWLKQNAAQFKEFTKTKAKALGLKGTDAETFRALKDRVGGMLKQAGSFAASTAGAAKDAVESKVTSATENFRQQRADSFLGETVDYKNMSQNQIDDRVKGLRDIIDDPDVHGEKRVKQATRELRRAQRATGRNFLGRAASATLKAPFRAAGAVAKPGLKVAGGIGLAGLPASLALGTADKINERRAAGTDDSTLAALRDVTGEGLDAFTNELSEDFRQRGGGQGNGLRDAAALGGTAFENIAQGFTALPGLVGDIVDAGEGLKDASLNWMTGGDFNLAESLSNARGGEFTDTLRGISSAGNEFFESEEPGGTPPPQNPAQAGVEATKPGLRAAGETTVSGGGIMPNGAGFSEGVNPFGTAESRAAIDKILSDRTRQFRERERFNKIMQLSRDAARGGKRGLAAATALQSIVDSDNTYAQAGSDAYQAELDASIEASKERNNLTEKQRERVDELHKDLYNEDTSKSVFSKYVVGDREAGVVVDETINSILYNLLGEDAWGALSDQIPDPDHVNFKSGLRWDNDAGTLWLQPEIEVWEGNKWVKKGLAMDTATKVNEVKDTLKEEFNLTDQLIGRVMNRIAKQTQR